MNPTVLPYVFGLCWRASEGVLASNNPRLGKLNGFCFVPRCAVAVVVTLAFAFAVAANNFLAYCVVDVTIAVAVFAFVLVDVE